MSEGTVQEAPAPAKKPKTKDEKQAEHIYRIKRTLLACLMGIFAGILSYYIGGPKDALGLQNDGFLGFMIMLACVVLQRHIFILMKIDTTRLGAKDWFYQGFMTFAFWFVTWTILLTAIA